MLIFRREQGKYPKKKKKRKGQNNEQSFPIVEERQRPDSDIDFQKPLAFTEIWHNKNDFNVALTKEFQRQKSANHVKLNLLGAASSAFPMK